MTVESESLGKSWFAAHASTLSDVWCDVYVSLIVLMCASPSLQVQACHEFIHEAQISSVLVTDDGQLVIVGGEDALISGGPISQSANQKSHLPVKNQN